MTYHPGAAAVDTSSITLCALARSFCPFVLSEVEACPERLALPASRRGRASSAALVNTHFDFAQCERDRASGQIDLDAAPRTTAPCSSSSSATRPIPPGRCAAGSRSSSRGCRSRRSSSRSTTRRGTGRRQGDEFAPSSGKVPILWDGDTVVWDSLAIVDWLADRVGREKFWPEDDAARAMARSMAAEMHSGYAALRREHGMNIRQRFPPRPLSAAVEAELARLFELWAQARARFGGERRLPVRRRSARSTSCSRRSARGW